MTKKLGKIHPFILNDLYVNLSYPSSFLAFLHWRWIPESRLEFTFWFMVLTGMFCIGSWRTCRDVQPACQHYALMWSEKTLNIKGNDLTSITWRTPLQHITLTETSDAIRTKTKTLPHPAILADKWSYTLTLHHNVLTSITVTTSRLTPVIFDGTL